MEKNGKKYKEHLKSKLIIFEDIFLNVSVPTDKDYIEDSYYSNVEVTFKCRPPQLLSLDITSSYKIELIGINHNNKYHMVEEYPQGVQDWIREHLKNNPPVNNWELK